MNRIKIFAAVIVSLVISTYQYGMQRPVGPIGASLVNLGERCRRIEADVRLLNAHAALLEATGRTQDAYSMRFRAHEQCLVGHLDVSLFDCDWMLDLVRYFDRNPTKSVAIMRLLSDTLHRFFIRYEAIKDDMHNFLEHNVSKEFSESCTSRLEYIESKIGELRGMLVRVTFALEEESRDSAVACYADEPDRFRATAASLCEPNSTSGLSGEASSSVEKVLQ